MAISFPNSITAGDAIRWAGDPVGSFPVSMHCRFKSDVAPQGGGLIGIYSSQSPSFRMLINVAGSTQKARMNVQTSTDSVVADSADSILAGQWYSVVGTGRRSGGTNYVECFIDKGASAGEVSLVNPDWPALDRTTSGRWDDSTPNLGFQGSLQNLAIWNVLLSQSDRYALASGVHPIKIRPEALRFLSAQKNIETLTDAISGNVGTIIGPVSSAPSVITTQSKSAIYTRRIGAPPVVAGQPIVMLV